MWIIDEVSGSFLAALQYDPGCDYYNPEALRNKTHNASSYETGAISSRV